MINRILPVKSTDCMLSMGMQKSGAVLPNKVAELAATTLATGRNKNIQAFLAILLLILIGCKKENYYLHYPVGSAFVLKSAVGPLTDFNQKGWMINVYMQDTTWLLNFNMEVKDSNLASEVEFTPTTPFTIVKECATCYVGQLGYYCKSNNNQLYMMPEDDIKLVK